MRATTLHLDAVPDLTTAERAAWGIVHYLIHGGWQQYGVMPPPSLCGLDSTHLSTPLLASTLGVTEAQAASLVSSLIAKGAMTVD